MSINHSRLNVSKQMPLNHSDQIAMNLRVRWDTFKKTHSYDGETLTENMEKTPDDIDFISVAENLYHNLNTILLDLKVGNKTESDEPEILERTLTDLLTMAMCNPGAHRNYLPQLIDLIKVESTEEIKNQHERMILQYYSIRIIGEITGSGSGHIRKVMPEFIRAFFENVTLEGHHPFPNNLELLKMFVNQIVCRCAVSNPHYIIPIILEHTGSRNFEVRKLCNEYMIKLTKSPQKAMASLIACLMRSDEELRCNAVQALGRLGLTDNLDRSAVIPYLLNSVNDPSNRVQIEAQAALESLEISTAKYKLAAGSVRRVRELINELKKCGIDLQSKEKLVHDLYDLMNQGNFERVIVMANLNHNELSNLRYNQKELTGVSQHLEGSAKEVASIYKDYSGLNIDFNFDEFKVGPQNFFAHGAAFTVASNPAVIINPLFIYGSPSSGKTHLINAIGNFALYNNPNQGVMYWNAGDFFKNFLTARETGQLGIFRELQSKTNMILIDDIQQLQGNPEAQTELLFAFDEIFNNKGQVVITSDRPPNEHRDFDKRLASRCTMGVVTGIGKIA
jgi:DNA replication protein DnaC